MLCDPDYILYVLLLDCAVQPGGDRKQPEKERRFHTRLQARKATSDYISRVLNRITWFAGFSAIITIAPIIMGNVTKYREYGLEARPFLFLWV